jgi:hypothetical protein
MSIVWDTALQCDVNLLTRTEANIQLSDNEGIVAECEFVLLFGDTDCGSYAIEGNREQLLVLAQRIMDKLSAS